MDWNAYARFALALVFVLGLIGVLATVAKRFGLGYRTVPRRGRPRRLAIVETMPVDAKRRLMLIRRDGTEHLVLVGGGGDLVIEGGLPAPPDDFANALASSPAPGAGR